MPKSEGLSKAKPTTSPIFMDKESELCVDCFERSKTGLSIFTEQILGFARDSKNLDYYQLLGIIGADTTDEGYEWIVKDAADNLTAALKNCMTDLKKATISGSKNDPDFTPGVGIISENDTDLKHTLNVIFQAKTLLPYEDPKRMYDADLGRKMAERILANKDQMSDLQILGIPVDQLPTSSEKSLEYVANATKLRLHQVFSASEVINPDSKLTMKDFELVVDVIKQSSKNLEDDIKAASKAEYSYQEFIDLIDVRGPMWEKVASTVGVKLEDLRLISRGTRKAMVSLARRHPGPIALFIAVELLAPSIYENLPRELKEKLHSNAHNVKKRLGDFITKDIPKTAEDFGTNVQAGANKLVEGAKDKFAEMFGR